MTKNNKRNKEKSTRFIIMLRRTLQDLSDDIDKTEAGSEASRRLLDALRPLRNDEIVPALKNHDSTLYNAIPIELLKSENGKAYLEILSLVTDFPEDVISTTGASDNGMPEFPDAIKSLAEELQRELELPEDITQIDISDLFNKVTTIMDRKTSSGEVNIEELQRSSRAVLNQLENSPALQSILSNPDLLSSFM